MYGHYRNSGIRRLYDYAEALRWHDNTPPIRGKGVNAGLRPLGHRGKMHFQIRKEPDGSIVCQCWQTDVVTFHPDGLVSIKSGGWTSQTTANFIQDVLSITCGVADKDLQLVVRTGEVYRLKDGMKLQRGANGMWEVVGAAPHTVYTINRKRMNELRKSVSPFRHYLSGMIKVRGGLLDKDELVDLMGDSLRETNWTLEVNHWREDVNQSLPRMKQFMEIISREDGGVGNWHSSFLQLIWSGRGWYQTIKTTPEQELRKLDELLIATHPEVLEEQTVKPGTFKKNKYAKFTKYKELQA